MESTNTGMEVSFATNLRDKKEVVIKTRERARSFKKASDERDWRATMEIQLNMPKTDTMCTLYELIETKQNYYVVMEKVEGRDLFECMAREKLSVKDARDITFQILTAVKSLHDAGRIHKDLKLENVMVDRSSPPTSPGTVKIIDFDTVQDWEPTSPKTRDVLGTDGYIAPEAYDGVYSPASDIYCVGVIMYRLLTRKFPSREDLFDDQPGENWVGSPAMKRIKERLRDEKIDFLRPPLNRIPAAADLCAKMLVFDPCDRINVDDALKHSWFGLNEDDLSPKAPKKSF
mmetsp:Transcript_60961/g.137667  ORF Transcript_60961/g.137667 Transcript_60961/m.137667 type:complete len:288 (+) Transcript_60961:2-865(+)